MPAIRQEPRLAVRGFVLGVSSIVTGTGVPPPDDTRRRSPLVPPEYDGAVTAPRGAGAPPWQIAENLGGAAGDVDFLQLAVRKKPEETAVRRPETRDPAPSVPGSTRASFSSKPGNSQSPWADRPGAGHGTRCAGHRGTTPDPTRLTGGNVVGRRYDRKANGDGGSGGVSVKCSAADCDERRAPRSPPRSMRGAVQPGVVIDAVGVDDAGAASASSISSRATPISGRRRFDPSRGSGAGACG